MGIAEMTQEQRLDALKAYVEDVAVTEGVDVTVDAKVPRLKYGNIEIVVTLSSGGRSSTFGIPHFGLPGAAIQRLVMSTISELDKLRIPECTDFAELGIRQLSPAEREVADRTGCRAQVVSNPWPKAEELFFSSGRIRALAEIYSVSCLAPSLLQADGVRFDPWAEAEQQFPINARRETRRRALAEDEACCGGGPMAPPDGWRWLAACGKWALHRPESEGKGGSLVFADDPDDSPWLEDPEKRAAWRLARRRTAEDPPASNGEL